MEQMSENGPKNISQSSVATVHRCSGHTNSCYVANYVTILCAKYCPLTFVENTVK